MDMEALTFRDMARDMDTGTHSADSVPPAVTDMDTLTAAASAPPVASDTVAPVTPSAEASDMDI